MKCIVHVSMKLFRAIGIKHRSMSHHDFRLFFYFVEIYVLFRGGGSGGYVLRGT